MAQTIWGYVSITRDMLDEFLVYWRRKHQEDPDNYPLRMEDGNEGAWGEQFANFVRIKEEE